MIRVTSVNETRGSLEVFFLRLEPEVVGRPNIRGVSAILSRLQYRHGVR